jgi:site-specific DNA-methyltransferase (adenine-specific)
MQRRRRKLEINKVYNLDCLEGMKLLPDNSVDSIVTDPPYELGFMGKKWDNTGIAYSVPVWTEALRVLKPGGHLLAFGGTRTYHRMTCTIEDAGFEIRDCIQWIYGSGFPKSMNIAIAIDKIMGADSIVVGKNLNARETLGTVNICKKNGSGNILSPSTPEAIQWDGWGTALKPANEPIVLARKPLSEKTIVANVLRWGTGGINVDASRIPLNGEDTSRKLSLQQGWKQTSPNGSGSITNDWSKGRFPANIIFDEETGKMLDQQSGIKASTRHMNYKRNGTEFINGIPSQPEKDWFTSETGGAQRFFKNIKWGDEDICGIILVSEKIAGMLSGAIQEIDQYIPDEKLCGFGKKQMEMSPKDMKFIISILTKLMTTLKILQPLNELNIKSFTENLDKIINLLTELNIENVNVVSNIFILQCFIKEAQKITEDIVKNVQRLNSENGKIRIENTLTNMLLDTVKNIRQADYIPFFYCAKASKADRGSGNIHPTVKPQSLMRYLCTLITPPGGTVLDPFTGSGSTLVAAVNLGFSYVGFELSSEYCDIAMSRINKIEDNKEVIL